MRRKLIYKSKSITADSSKKQFSSPKTSRKIINTYHTLQKDLLKETDQEKKKLIQQKINDIGLDLYQKASLLGQSNERGGDSSKWLLSNLPRELNEKIKLLDVGALKNNYKNYDYIEPTCIDLNSQNPAEIIEADFFTFPPPKDELFDIVCLSLVFNFVPEPIKRGEMIKRVKLFLKEKGYLYVVLPLACVENSRYMTNELFVEMTEAVGFSITKSYQATKLAYFLFQRDGLKSKDCNLFGKKTVLRTGNRNNFCILFE